MSITDRDRKSVTLDLAADLCGVTRRTLYNWIKAGKLTAFDKDGSKRVYVDLLPAKDERRQYRGRG